MTREIRENPKIIDLSTGDALEQSIPQRLLISQQEKALNQSIPLIVKIMAQDTLLSLLDYLLLMNKARSICFICITNH